MRGHTRILLLLAVFLTIAPRSVEAWGFYAHKRINRLAVMTLPSELMNFYKANLDFITEHAIDPDKRRHGVEAEAARHYIDIDHYSEENPFEVMPRRWKEAVAKYSEDTLQAYGIVPWHVSRMVYRLTKAFKERDLDRILRLSADLGHYVGDAHVPLHTTENYNGQLTGQRGIHGFWESRLPELYADQYDFFVGPVEYVERPLDAIWEAVEKSHNALDSVLIFERELNNEFSGDRKYSFEQRGGISIKVYSQEYSQAYHERLNGMVERRMRAAIKLVGCLWYTAWVDAGKPDLVDLKEAEISTEYQQELTDQDQRYGSEKIKGREHSK